MTIQLTTSVSGNNNTSNASMTTSSIVVAAGDAILLLVAKDNIQTTTTESTDVSSVTDPGSNTWYRIYEYTYGQGGAAAGATLAVWMCPHVVTGFTGNITINYATTTAKAAVGYKVTKDTAKYLACAGLAAAVATGDTASMTLTLPSGYYLYVRGVAVENTTVAWSANTAGYGNMAETTAGSGATGIKCMGESYYTGANLTTGTTSDPTLDTGSLDNVSVLFALTEVSFYPPQMIGNF